MELNNIYMLLSMFIALIVLLKYFLDPIKKSFDKLEVKIDNVEKNLNARIDNLEEKIDNVEKNLNARIDKVEDKLDNVDKRVYFLERKFDNMEIRFSNMDEKINILDDKIQKLHKVFILSIKDDNKTEIPKIKTIAEISPELALDALEEAYNTTPNR